MRSVVFAALAVSTTLAHPAGAVTVLDRSVLSVSLIAVLATTGQSLVDRLPMRATPFEEPQDRKVTSVAYSPTGVRWGWTDDGKVCFQPFPELAWPEGLADAPGPSQVARMISPPEPWQPASGGDWTGGGTPLFPSTGTGGGSPLPGPGSPPGPGSEPGPGPGEPQPDPKDPTAEQEPPPAPVPLPAPGLLLIAGIGAMAVVRRRR